MRAFVLMKTNSRLVLLDFEKKTATVYDDRVALATYEITGLIAEEDLESIRTSEYKDLA